MITAKVEDDLKHIKKLNTLFSKLEKSASDAQTQEIVNVFTILNNSIYLEKALSVFYNVIDERFHPDMEDIIFDMMAHKC